MSNSIDIKDIRKQVQKLQKQLQERIGQADKDSERFVVNSCAEIERTAKSIMRDSPVNPDVTYGRKGHHPSYAGNPPAPDTGTLLQSVTHSIEVKDKQVIGYVGSVIKNPDYPRYLEYGTSKMKPRPWLSASIAKCEQFMKNLWQEIFGK